MEQRVLGEQQCTERVFLGEGKGIIGESVHLVTIMNATLRATRLLAWHMAQGRGAMNYSASAGGDKYFYMDKIRLSGLLFHGFHGVLPEVREQLYAKSWPNVIVRRASLSKSAGKYTWTEVSGRCCHVCWTEWVAGCWTERQSR